MRSISRNIWAENMNFPALFGSQLWTPANTIMEGWWDASDLSTITVDTGGVSQLNDKSGNDQHLTQPLESARPATGTHTLNDLNMFFFNGSEALATYGDDFVVPTSGNFIVYQIAESFLPLDNVADGMFSMLNAAGRDWQYVGGVNVNDWNGRAVVSELGGVNTNFSPPAGVGPALYSLEFNFDASTITGYVSGSDVGGTTYTLTVTSPQTFITMSNRVGNALAGHFGEVFIDENVAESQRQRNEGYILWKWGLQSQLPVGHPYKDAPPMKGDTVEVPMIITANTTLAGSAPDTLQLPVQGVNVVVDWGDGNIDSYLTSQLAEHEYSTGGVKTVNISSTTGQFQGLKYNFFDDNSNDRRKLLDVTQWGSSSWPNMKNAFRSCSNLTVITAADAPNLRSVTDMTSAFQFCTGLTTFPTNWDMSDIQLFESTWEGTPLMTSGFDNYDLSGATTLKRAWYQYTNLVGLLSWNCTTSTALLSVRETWYKCDLRDCTANIDIINQSLYAWVLSASGTSEYYLTRIDGFDPSGLTYDIANIVEDPLIMLPVGTIGALAAGEYVTGDNDTLGFNTVYVRLTDSANPNTKPGYFLTLRDKAVLPEFESSAVTDYAAPWVITGLRNIHPDISFASATDIEGIIFGGGFMGLNNELMGANWQFPEVTNGLSAMQSAANTKWTVPILCPKLSDGTDFLQGAGRMTPEQYQLTLENFRDINPNNSVTYHAGTSQRNADGQDAYAALIALPRSWTIADGGMLDDYLLDEDEFTIRDEGGDPIIVP